MPRSKKWLADVSGECPADEAARQIVKERLRAVQDHITQARHSTGDAEAIHQLRVWTRRAESALGMFKPLLAKKHRKWMKKRLRRLRRAAGAVRDCDVHLEHLSRTKSPGRALRKGVARSRRRSQKDLKSILQRLARRQRFADQAAALVENVYWQSVDSPVAPYGTFARQALQQQAEAYFEAAAADIRDDEALHALRIAAKRWRYALELAAGVLRAPWARELYNGLNEVQNRLGEVHDQAALSAWIEESLRVETGKRRQGKIEKLLDRQRLQRGVAREDLRRWWTRSRRKKLESQWQQAVRTLEDVPARTASKQSLR